MRQRDCFVTAISKQSRGADGGEAVEVEGVWPEPHARIAATSPARETFLLHIGRLVRVDAQQPQDRSPRHRLAAETAKMAGEEVRIAPSCHSLPSVSP